jgi:hypothetical protein
VKPRENRCSVPNGRNGIRAIASLKTALGKEELLEGMSSLARRLAELP